MGAMLGKNGLVYIICALIGFGIAHLLPPGLWAALAYLLITYHLFLGWLVFSAEHKAGISLPIGTTILTHLACLALVVCFAMGRHIIPFFGLIRYFVPALAPFEVEWLFKASNQNPTNKPVSASKAEAAKKAAAVANAVAAAATVDDYEEWLKYLALPNRPPRKPGLSVQDEYKQWLVSRARSRIAPGPKP